MTDVLREVRKEDPLMLAAAANQQGIITVGQRRINLILEYTQALVAVFVVSANMIVGVCQGIGWPTTTDGIPEVLSNSLFLVVGFYFSRSSHTAIGNSGQVEGSNAAR